MYSSILSRPSTGFMASNPPTDRTMMTPLLRSGLIPRRAYDDWSEDDIGCSLVDVAHLGPGSCRERHCYNEPEQEFAQVSFASDERETHRLRLARVVRRADVCRQRLGVQH